MEIIVPSFMIIHVAIIVVFGALLIALAHLVVDNKYKQDNNRKKLTHNYYDYNKV